MVFCLGCFFEVPLGGLHVWLLFFTLLDQTGEIPIDTSVVIPIYKKRVISFDPANDRPFSLLAVLDKVYTMPLGCKLKSCIDSCNILGPEQFGFSIMYNGIILSHLSEKYIQMNRCI